ncbi:MAG: DUF1569 domain-containing protein [Bacteroidota bacterium]
MTFVSTEIEDVLAILDQLDPEKKPLWGTMSAQRMVEHLTDVIRLASGKDKFELVIPAEKVEKAQAFIFSDFPMPKDFKVPFAKETNELRHEEIELAIDEFLLEWIDFENYYIENEGIKTLHPNFGELNYEQWVRLHSKHLTHHFQQFELI